jgi:hypothetical protein
MDKLDGERSCGSESLILGVLGLVAQLAMYRKGDKLAVTEFYVPPPGEELKEYSEKCSEQPVPLGLILDSFGQLEMFRHLNLFNQVDEVSPVDEFFRS